MSETSLVAAQERTTTFAALRKRLDPEFDTLIAQYEDSRSALLPIITRFQEEEGYVSSEAIDACAELLQLSRSVVESTVSFYTLLFRKPVGRYMLQVCRNLSCSINGADEIMERVRERLGISHLETTEDGLFSYEEVECLAACDRAPCMQVNLEFLFDLTPERIDTLVEQIRAGTCTVPARAQTQVPERTWRLAPGGH